MSRDGWASYLTESEGRSLSPEGPAQVRSGPVPSRITDCPQRLWAAWLSILTSQRRDPGHPTWSNLRCFFSSEPTSCRCCSKSMVASSSSCCSRRRPLSSRSTASVFSVRRWARVSASRAARRRASSPASRAPASSSWRRLHSESWGGGGGDGVRDSRGCDESVGRERSSSR